MKQLHELNLVKNHDLHIKLTEPQKRKIAENAQAAGLSLSDFVRHIALEEGYTMEQRIREIHEAILGQKNQSRQRCMTMPTKTYEQQTRLYGNGINPEEYNASGQDNYS